MNPRLSRATIEGIQRHTPRTYDCYQIIVQYLELLDGVEPSRFILGVKEVGSDVQHNKQ